jgi:hypothetical protein
VPSFPIPYDNNAYGSGAYIGEQASQYRPTDMDRHPVLILHFKHRAGGIRMGDVGIKRAKKKIDLMVSEVD